MYVGFLIVFCFCCGCRNYPVAGVATTLLRVSQLPCCGCHNYLVASVATDELSVGSFLAFFFATGSAGLRRFRADVESILYGARGFKESCGISAELRGQPQGVGAGLHLCGDDEGDGGGVVDDPEVGGDGGLGAVFGDEGEAHGGVLAGDADVASRQGEGASGGGAGVVGLGGDVLHAGDGDARGLGTEDVDLRLADGLAEVGAGVEVDDDFVFFSVPLAVLDEAAEGDGGVVEAGVDGVSAEEEAFDDAFLQFEDVEDGLAAQAGVFGLHLGQDALFIGGLARGGHGVDVLRVVRGQAVVLQEGVDAVGDFVCHNGWKCKMVNEKCKM